MPSRATLARRMHKKSTDSVDRALKELVATGAVSVEHRYNGVSGSPTPTTCGHPDPLSTIPDHHPSCAPGDVCRLGGGCRRFAVRGRFPE